MRLIRNLVDFIMGSGFVAAGQAHVARLRHEEMRRRTDDFGNGPIIRYGDDRYGLNDLTSQEQRDMQRALIESSKFEADAIPVPLNWLTHMLKKIARAHEPDPWKYQTMARQTAEEILGELGAKQ